MRHRTIFIFPLVFAVVGSLILILAGDEVEFAGWKDNLVLGQWEFVVLGIIFNTGLFFLYKWLLRRKVSRAIFWLHFISTFLGMAIFLYLMLPWNDEQSLDGMLRGLTWVLASMFLLLVGVICLLILIFTRPKLSVESQDQSADDEHSPE